MPELSVLVKPASSGCNLRCKYCFYLVEAGERRSGNRGVMSPGTAKNLITKAFEAAEGRVSFAFQGGEPTLAGLRFYRDFTNWADEANARGIAIRYALQTNGQLIDAEWAEFLREREFLVGVSLDGTKEIHDGLRGSGSYARAERAIRLLTGAGVACNVLTVVTSGVARHCESIYRKYLRAGYEYVQFIDCLGEELPFLPTAEQYGDFLVRLYRLWTEDGRRMRIRYFDNLQARLLGGRTELCGMNGYCSNQFVIESDGSAYPCDFYCTDGYVLGNVNELSFRELYEGETGRKFLGEGANKSSQCAACPWSALCQGVCRREWEGGRNPYCEGYRRFFREFFPVK